MVTSEYQNASPPVLIFPSGDTLSNWSTSTLETVRTIMVSRMVVKEGKRLMTIIGEDNAKLIELGARDIEEYLLQIAS